LYCQKSTFENFKEEWKLLSTTEKTKNNSISVRVIHDLGKNILRCEWVKERLDVKKQIIDDLNHKGLYN
jgi:hypothetical protein